jgi:hypothetical protein
LILFEQCTIESIMLKEVPALISVFGVEGLLRLLDSGAVRIICDAMTVGQIGQTAILQSAAARGGPLPLGSYRLATVGVPLDGPGREDYLHIALQEVHKAKISPKEAKRVKLALVPRLQTYSTDAANAGVEDTRAELLQHHPGAWDAIRHTVLKETGTDLAPKPEFEVEDLGQDGAFRISTSLTTKHGMPLQQAHKLVERSILGVAGMNQRIRFMESFGAVTGFQADEIPLFESKLSFLLCQVDPDAQEQRFDRIATIGGLPGVDGLPAGTTVDVCRLLALRDDAECQELRRWIRNVDSETDDEINAQFESVRKRLASVVDSHGGRAVRFVVTAGAGLIPIIGVGAGPILSAGDAFLLEKIIGRPGPATFLSKHYRSIFED